MGPVSEMLLRNEETNLTVRLKLVNPDIIAAMIRALSDAGIAEPNETATMTDNLKEHCKAYNKTLSKWIYVDENFHKQYRTPLAPPSTVAQARMVSSRSAPFLTRQRLMIPKKANNPTLPAKIVPARKLLHPLECLINSPKGFMKTFVLNSVNVHTGTPMLKDSRGNSLIGRQPEELQMMQASFNTNHWSDYLGVNFDENTARNLNYKKLQKWFSSATLPYKLRAIQSGQVAHRVMSADTFGIDVLDSIKEMDAFVMPPEELTKWKPGIYQPIKDTIIESTPLLTTEDGNSRKLVHIGEIQGSGKDVTYISLPGMGLSIDFSVEPLEFVYNNVSYDLTVENPVDVMEIAALTSSNDVPHSTIVTTNQTPTLEEIVEDVV